MRLPDAIANWIKAEEPPPDPHRFPPHIYCLTLKEEPWRQEQTGPHFESLGLDYSFFYGFYGPTLGIAPEFACDLSPNGTRTLAHVTQLAHTISYLALLRAVLLRGDETFIVVEDDARFATDFIDRWNLVSRSLEKNCDVAQLSYCHHADKPSIQIDEHLSRCFYPFGCDAIWWTKDAAELAIRSVRPICEPCDIAFIRRLYPFCRHAIVTPNMCSDLTSNGTWTSSIGLESKPISSNA